MGAQFSNIALKTWSSDPDNPALQRAVVAASNVHCTTEMATTLRADLLHPDREVDAGVLAQLRRHDNAWLRHAAWSRSPITDADLAHVMAPGRVDERRALMRRPDLPEEVIRTVASLAEPVVAAAALRAPDGVPDDILAASLSVVTAEFAREALRTSFKTRARVVACREASWSWRLRAADDLVHTILAPTTSALHYPSGVSVRYAAALTQVGQMLEEFISSGTTVRLSDTVNLPTDQWVNTSTACQRLMRQILTAEAAGNSDTHACAQLLNRLVEIHDEHDAEDPTAHLTRLIEDRPTAPSVAGLVAWESVPLEARSAQRAADVLAWAQRHLEPWEAAALVAATRDFHAHAAGEVARQTLLAAQTELPVPAWMSADWDLYVSLIRTRDRLAIHESLAECTAEWADVPARLVDNVVTQRGHWEQSPAYEVLFANGYRPDVAPQLWVRDLLTWDSRQPQLLAYYTEQVAAALEDVPDPGTFLLAVEAMSESDQRLDVVLEAAKAAS